MFGGPAMPARSPRARSLDERLFFRQRLREDLDGDVAVEADLAREVDRPMVPEPVLEDLEILETTVGAGLGAKKSDNGCGRASDIKRSSLDGDSEHMLERRTDRCLSLLDIIGKSRRMRTETPRRAPRTGRCADSRPDCRYVSQLAPNLSALPAVCVPAPECESGTSERCSGGLLDKCRRRRSRGDIGRRCPSGLAPPT